MDKDRISARDLLILSVFVPSCLLVWKVREHFGKMNEIIKRAKEYNSSVLASISATSALPAVSRELSAKVSASPLTQLIAMRDRGEVTCEELVLIHVHNLRTYGSGFHTVLAERIGPALEEAREYDRRIKAGEKVGVLAGIPFSVKDGVSAEGMPTTFGCVSLVHNRMNEDANLVKVLKENGAILLVKGSMGMLGSTSECENRTVGRCENPWDRTRTSGGSSGGDSVLVCTRSVAFAVGTDIGGSLRYPASYCGIYTMKPTATRLSGQAPICKSGFPPLFTAWGFLARSMDDLVLLYSLAYCSNMYARDPLAVPLLWRQDRFENTDKLRIGYVVDNDFWPAADCCKRIVSESVDVLRKGGHELVEFDLGDLHHVIELSWKVFMSSSDGANRLKQELPIWSMRHIAWRRLMPWFVITFFYYLDRKTMSTMMWKALYETSILNMLQNVSEGDQMRDSFYRRMQAQHLDALLVPFAFPAFLHEMTPWNTYSCAWTLIFNLIDMPVGSLPLGVVREDEQKYGKGKCVYVKSTDRVMEGAAGLPLSIQVVAKRYQDETCLRLMKELSLGLPFNHTPPGLDAVINP